MFKRKILIWIVAVGILAVAFLTYLGYLSLNGNNVKTENRINVGVLLPLSGNPAQYGISAQKGMELARDELSYEYPDTNIEIYYEDSLYTPQGGVNAYKQLSELHNVDSIITGASQVSLAVAPLTKEKEILQMAIFSSAEKYTSSEDMTFRISTRNEIEAEVMAKFIKNKEYAKIGIIYLNNDFGVGFKGALKSQLERENIGDKVVDEEAVDLGATEYRSVLAKLKDDGVDAIFMAGITSQYASILKEASEINLEADFLSMRSAEDPTLVSNAGRLAEGLIYTYPFDVASSGEETMRFVSAYKENYGAEPDSYSAEGYEGLMIVGRAFGKCGKDNSCIFNYLSSLKNYPSVFGNLSFDENGDVLYPYFLKTIKNGSFVSLFG